MAEVLITLGVIGVVAAVAMPTLIEHHQKKVVSTRIKKFYSVMNQAVRLSEVEYGDYRLWDYPENNDADEMTVFFNKYFGKHLNVLEVTTSSSENFDNDGNPTGLIYNYILVKFSDGSGMSMRYEGGLDISFYPNASNIGKSTLSPARKSFSFNFNKSTSVGNKSFVEPFNAGWDGTIDGLKNHVRYGCRKNSPSYMYCAKLLQQYNWEITDDYPW